MNVDRETANELRNAVESLDATLSEISRRLKTIATVLEVLSDQAVGDGIQIRDVSRPRNLD